MLEHAALWVAVLVGLQRLGELLWSARNERRLRARGALEHGAAHYPWLVAMHAAWLIGLPIVVPAGTAPDLWLLGLFLALQPLRVWCIASLGDRWTTRVLVPPSETPVRRGPYAWMRHPNYAIVAAEIALLPLAFGAVGWALGFSLANALLLAIRVRVEEQALATAPG